MRLPLCFVFLVAVAASASAREEELAPEGVSPDKHYTVFVEQGDTPHAIIYYVVRDRRTGKSLGKFKSSYQDEGDDEGDFPWKQSHPSWIYWRADSRYVALDEANHNHIGTVILAHRRKSSFRQVPVSEDKLMHYTKQPWDRGRLFFGDNCFLPHDRAAVAIIGFVRRPHSDQYDEFGCTVILDLRANGKIVRAVIPR